jgi:DNA-binding response OmpR family regulator
MNSLLLLEDDQNLGKSLVKYLEKANYEVDWARDGEEALDFTYNNKYALYLFDINVPLINGIDLLGELRDAEDFTPTIIISALVDIESVTKGFMAGADDYLKKPFDPEELLIHIKAKTGELKQQLHFRKFEVDIQKHEIFKESKLLQLGEVQKRLVISLIQHYPNPVTKDTLLELLEKPTDLALRVNINKLKKQFELPIKNVRNIGYQLY